MELFGRTVRVDVNGLQIRNLDVRFTVDKTETPEPDKAEITVYNLNEPHRESLEQQDIMEVRLHVGYLTGTESQLFRGDTREAFSVHRTPDWVTTLRTGDGDKQVRSDRISKSYAPGTSFETAWKDATGALERAGVGIGNAIEKFKEGKFEEGIKAFANGGNLNGSTFKELQRLGRLSNLDVSIQDKELLVTKVGQPLSTPPVILSRETGLIGSPHRGAKGELRLRALLVPGLDPRRKVEVRSRLINGVYAIQRGRYSGDTSSNDWYADLECLEVAA